MTRPSPKISLANLLKRPSIRALLGLFILILVALVVAPRTLELESLKSMAPFVGILGVAAIGQHLVVQQRGFDLSVAGSISLAAVVVTVFAPADASLGLTVTVIVAAMIIGVLGGFLNGAVINWFGVPPLVMTIGVNALLIGFVFYLTNAAVYAAPDLLVSASKLRMAGLSILFLIFVVMAAVAIWVIDRTRTGRRYIMTAVSPSAAHALGIRVSRYNILTYCIAGLLFSISGIMIAGLAVTPTLQSGGSYMLTTIAAVIVGGSPLNGDKGSLFATMVGAVFLVFLNQLVASLGFDYAIQSMVQAAIILAGVTIPSLMQNARQPKAAIVPSDLVVDQTPGSQATLTKLEATSAAIIELTGVRKHFGNTIALSDVSFSALPGEVHAIIGENGAGKSTLISIAAGVLPATAGQVRIEGELLDSSDPIRFRDAGVSVAFQHPPLPPHLSVRECLSLAAVEFGEAGGLEKAQAVIDRVTIGSLSVRPTDRISDLSIGQLHVVEIARALASKPKILILDEPTEPFKEGDVKHLFNLIRELKSEGVCIIYISHRLNEVEDIADRISVLRDGELIDTRPRSEFTRAQIIDMIVGRPLGQVFPAKHEASDEAPVTLSVNNLSGDMFHGIHLSARRGEIIGFAGVEGQGQRELIRALAGLERHTGTVRLSGQAMSLSDRTDAWEHGVAFVPDDRHHEGLFLSLTVAENLGVGYRDDHGQPLLIDRAQEAAVVESSIDGLRIRTSSPEALVSSLSGGNQQKVLMGREIAASPRILLTDEPTKGVDIGSKSDIYNKLRYLADQGVTIVVSSSDGVELEGLCDRVLVMARGEIVSELTGDQVTDAEITAANLTAGENVAKRQNDSGAATWVKTMLNSKWLPAVALSMASLVIIYFAAAANIRFLSSYNLSNVQVQLATLALIAFGQLFVMLLGEIDFSSGPLAGLAVVLASFWIPDGASVGMVIIASVGIVVVSMLIGLFQGLLVVLLKLPSIVVTLTGFFAIQGVSLSLRPVPGGTISYRFVDTLLYHWGPISLVSVVVVIACIAFERILFHKPFGRVLRAVGSDRDAAEKLGAKHRVLTPVAFAINGALIGMAGLILAATVGVGTGTAGVNFTLMSITAVVLGGAVISGGYGSFASTLFGAILVQATFSATAFMQVGVQWQHWLVGLSTLFAASLFSFGRRNKPH